MELKDATVLVVDDESMLLDIFSDWLEEESCHVLTAGDGAAALQAVLREHVDVIVSDVRMPVMDGITLMENLTAPDRKLPNSYRPKVIFISGFTDLQPREAYDLGCEEILQKPIERVHFVDAVRRALRSREEKWSDPQAESGSPLQVALPCVSAAIEQGHIAFGQGGFCLRYSSPVTEGPVRFDLEFEAEPVSLAGNGVIRWAEPGENVLGVEIAGLDKACLAWAMSLIATHAGMSYIPRAPRSATPGRRVSKG